MNRNAGLILLLFIAFAAAGSWFYLCKVKAVCAPLPVVDSSIKSSIEEPIVFSWGSDEPMKGNGFAHMHKHILEELGDVGSLEIIALYDPREGDLELGAKRAAQVAALFPSLDSSRFSMLSMPMPLDSNKAYFTASKLNVIFGHQHPF